MFHLQTEILSTGIEHLQTGLHILCTHNDKRIHCVPPDKVVSTPCNVLGFVLLPVCSSCILYLVFWGFFCNYFISILPGCCQLFYFFELVYQHIGRSTFAYVQYVTFHVLQKHFYVGFHYLYLCTQYFPCIYSQFAWKLYFYFKFHSIPWGSSLPQKGDCVFYILCMAKILFFTCFAA